MAGAGIAELLSRDNPVFAAYAFYAAILVGKMLLMSFLTGRQRFKNKVFASPEDVKGMKDAKVRYDHPDVERVRRAHLNDMENIPVFLIIALLYILTNPTQSVAITLIRAFSFARIIHTLVYAVFVIPQPTRAIAFFTGQGITWFMIYQTLLHFL